MFKHTFTFMFTAAAMAAFCGASLQAQIPDNQMIDGICNGRWWLQASEPIRLGYILGYTDHLTAVGPDAVVKFPATLTFGEVSKAVTIFYGEPANLEIPVYGAFHFVEVKASGATPAELEQQISNVRAACRRSREKQTSKGAVPAPAAVRY